MRELENKVVLITSATRGIGLACALKLAEADASVHMGVRRLQVVQEVCDEYHEKGYKMIPIYFDATDKSSHQSMVGGTVQEADQINILVDNFDIGRPAEDLDLVSNNESAFFDILDLNLGNAYRVSRLVVPHMLRAGDGSIVNISSIGGMIPDITRIDYGVSKSTINNITRRIVVQFTRRNVRCNAVLPGLIATDAALEGMSEESPKSFLSHIPLNRMGTPEGITNTVFFLSCDDSAYITGHILGVAGGYGIGTPQYGDMMRE